MASVPIIKRNNSGNTVLCCCDGSRMSNLAFGVAARLRGKGGALSVLHVSDRDKPGLPGHLNPAYLQDLFELNCTKYSIPSRSWRVDVIERGEDEDTGEIKDCVLDDPSYSGGGIYLTDSCALVATDLEFDANGGSRL